MKGLGGEGDGSDAIQVSRRRESPYFQNSNLEGVNWQVFEG